MSNFVRTLVGAKAKTGTPRIIRKENGISYNDGNGNEVELKEAFKQLDHDDLLQLLTTDHLVTSHGEIGRRAITKEIIRRAGTKDALAAAYVQYSIGPSLPGFEAVAEEIPEDLNVKPAAIGTPAKKQKTNQPAVSTAKILPARAAKEQLYSPRFKLDKVDVQDIHSLLCKYDKTHKGEGKSKNGPVDLLFAPVLEEINKLKAIKGGIITRSDEIGLFTTHFKNVVGGGRSNARFIVGAKLLYAIANHLRNAGGINRYEGDLLRELLTFYNNKREGKSAVSFELYLHAGKIMTAGTIVGI